MENEVRLVDANWILREIDHDLGCYEIEKMTADDALYVELRDVVKMVWAAPTINPESLRPKGRWTENRRVEFSDIIGDDVYWFTYTCSECGGEVMNDYHYCPNCGAKMEG